MKVYFVYQHACLLSITVSFFAFIFHKVV